MPNLQSMETRWLDGTKCEPNEELREFYIERIRKRVDSGVRTGVHASEVDGSCLYKTVLRRDDTTPPDLEEDNILRFMRGWALENYIAPGLQLPVIRDGITCSVDDIIPVLGTKRSNHVEIKSTAKSLTGFDPIHTYYWWTHRMMIYAHANNKTEFNLVAYFVRGNYKDIQHAFKAWTYTWIKSELEKFWKEYVLPRRDLLKLAFAGEYNVESLKIPLIFDKGKNECSWCEWKKCNECTGV